MSACSRMMMVSSSSYLRHMFCLLCYLLLIVPKIIAYCSLVIQCYARCLRHFPSARLISFFFICFAMCFHICTSISPSLSLSLPKCICFLPSSPSPPSPSDILSFKPSLARRRPAFVCVLHERAEALGICSASATLFSIHARAQMHRREQVMKGAPMVMNVTTILKLMVARYMHDVMCWAATRTKIQRFAGEGCGVCRWRLCLPLHQLPQDASLQNVPCAHAVSAIPCMCLLSSSSPGTTYTSSTVEYTTFRVC